MQVSVIDCHPALATTSVSASLAKDTVSVSSLTLAQLHFSFFCFLSTSFTPESKRMISTIS